MGIMSRSHRFVPPLVSQSTPYPGWGVLPLLSSFPILFPPGVDDPLAQFRLVATVKPCPRLLHPLPPMTRHSFQPLHHPSSKSIHSAVASTQRPIPDVKSGPVLDGKFTSTRRPSSFALAVT